MKQENFRNEEWEKKIDALLKKMTVEEKIGQLTLVGPSPVGGFEISVEEQKKLLEAGRITQAEYERAVQKIPLDKQESGVEEGKLGAFIGIVGREKADRLQRLAVEKSRLGIPLLFGLDVIHGMQTIFPIPLAESCCWDEEIWEKTAAAAAREAASHGIKWTYAPMVDIARDARWGRIAEGAGEDTLLGSRCAAAKVRGFQGENLADDDRLVACAKHYIAYGACEGGRDYNTVDMSLQKLYEVYLPPFKAAVDAGVATVMPAFNDFNGIPCTTNRWLLQTVLRGELGFSGFTVSDANAIAECVDHGSASDRGDAARAALQSGTDMDMGSFCYPEHLQKMLTDGVITGEQLDAAVRRVLRVKFAAGLFEAPYRHARVDEETLVAHRQLAFTAAVRSAVLLKNNGVLPLSEKTPLLLVGELADAPEEMLGTWSGKWGLPAVTVKEGLLAAGGDVTYLPCCGPQTAMQEEQLRAAVGHPAKTVIAVVGENAGQTGEAASYSRIALSESQQRLLRELKAAGKTVITVLCNGRPLALGMVHEISDAVLELWHAGTEAGNAAAALLYGKENPSGRLTASFPYSDGCCPVYYNSPNTGRPCADTKFSTRYADAPTKPLYPFGFGLSYTTYTYSNLRIHTAADALEVFVTVKNSGTRAGIETVQLYVRDLVAARVRPVAELKNFCRLPLAAGEQKTVKLCVPFSSLGYYDENMHYVTEAGVFRLRIGDLTQDVELSAKDSPVFSM